MPGVGVDPDKTILEPESTLAITLVFGPIDPGVRKLSLYEGEDARKLKPGEAADFWAVRDIELK